MTQQRNGTAEKPHPWEDFQNKTPADDTPVFIEQELFKSTTKSIQMLNTAATTTINIITITKLKIIQTIEVKLILY